MNCLTKGHENRVVMRRGLCGSCYQAAKRAIRLKKTTDKELVDLGMILPRKRPGKGDGYWMTCLKSLRDGRGGAE